MIALSFLVGIRISGGHFGATIYGRVVSVVISLIVCLSSIIGRSFADFGGNSAAKEVWLKQLSFDWLESPSRIGPMGFQQVFFPGRPTCHREDTKP